MSVVVHIAQALWEVSRSLGGGDVSLVMFLSALLIGLPCVGVAVAKRVAISDQRGIPASCGKYGIIP